MRRTTLKLSSRCATALAIFVFFANNAEAVLRIAVSEIVVAPVVKAVVTSNLCPNNDVDVYKIGPATNDLGVRFSVKCRTANFVGSSENEIQFDSSGGSIGAFLQSNSGSQEALAADGAFVPSNTPGCASTAGTGVYAFIGSGRLKTCPTTATLQQGKVVGGFMEMPVPLYAYQGLLATQAAASAMIIPTSLTATYGVAVSSSFFEVLQQDQGLQTGVSNATPPNQPSISKAAITSLISDAYSDVKLNGLKFFAPSQSTQAITYCILPRRSGVQAFANAYFLNNGIGTDGAMGGAISPLGPAEAGAADEEYEKVTTKMNANIAEQKACLSGGGYRIGFLPGTENPIKYGEAYRFIKLSRIELSEGTAAATNTLTARAGEYDFANEVNVFNPTSNILIDKMTGLLYYGTGSGLYVNGYNAGGSAQSYYGRGGNPALPFFYNQ